MPVTFGNASVRDRTREFMSVAERLKTSVQSGDAIVAISGSRGEAQRSAVAMQSEFNTMASRIGFGIHQTSQKLSKLAKLAKRTSAYNDPTMEIQDLTAVIKQDITALNSAVIDLQLHCNSRSDSGNLSADTASHSTTVVHDLKNRLMSTTKEFKDVLTVRTENLKTQEDRRQIYSSSASKRSTSIDSKNPFARQRPLSARSAASSSSNPPPPWSGASSSESFHRNQVEEDNLPLMQQQQQVFQQEIQNNNYMQSRADALQNVEATIHELGHIFNQLATLVSQQGEIAIRIDENMEDTVANVEGAQGQLLKYLSGISSNRWLIIKIFFVLVFFLTIFMFFVA